MRRLAMKGRNRNAPCWCGSGEKFKKCHLGRDSQAKRDPWIAVKQNKKAFSQKKCCARDSGLGNCEGPVIKAHTVSRGSNLVKIAKNSHVLHYTTNIPDM
ncbi:MAG: SEC-C metal-binding domain-containing protein, partial [Paracoccaceae bacterium]